MERSWDFEISAYVGIGLNKSDIDCIPNPPSFYPATQCPVSYEAVRSSSYTHDWDDVTTTGYVLYCCPT